MGDVFVEGVLSQEEKTLHQEMPINSESPSIVYGAHFKVKKGDIGPENTCFV